MWKMILGVVPLAAAFVGCAPSGRSADKAATSLVYSPGERLQASREAEGSNTTGERLRAGVRCRVHLRRDAAGLAGQAPVSIVGASRLSEMASVAGVVERVGDDAVTIRGDGSTYWIPRGAILAVEFPDERRP